MSAENGTYTTMAQTADGRRYNLGEREHPPKHDHGGFSCPGCVVVNAWTAREAR